jgi:peptidoglycan/LPS O-acetylase OafA/YrhL
VKSTDRLYIIDLLRFVAAFTVMIYHLAFRCYVDHEAPLRFEASEPVVRYFTLAVQLFFMISGFVICWSTEGKRPLQFVWSRFVRLFPTYWLCVTLTFIVCRVWGSAATQVSFMDYVKNLTMLEQYLKAPMVDIPYWTLAEELRFYGITFACLLVRYRNWMVVAGAWVGLSAVDFFIHHIPVAHYELSLRYCPFFAAGMVYYQMFRQGPNRWQLGLLVACLVMGCVRFNELASHDVKTQLNPLVSSAVITGIFVLFGLVATRRLQVRQSYRWMTVMGGMTYPLYLLHNRIGAVFLQHTASSMNHWALLLIDSAIACLLAWIVWRCFEGPVARYLNQHKPAWIDSAHASALETDGALARKSHT